MPRASKAYILKIDTPVSNEYAAMCAESCDNVNLPWTYFQGVENPALHALNLARVTVTAVGRERGVALAADSYIVHKESIWEI